MGVLAYYKIDVTLHTYGTNVDGGFYTDVAAHVRDGHGLVSSCSTLHAGYPRFPFPTAVYPLWPLLLGWVAKVVPIFEAGKWLATACYFATLGFAYLWGRALHGEPLLPRIAPGFDAGHVIVLMFGMHEYFFQYTSFPYTEGLTYALTCAALWRMTRLLPRPTWIGGLEIGVWLGLVVLGRYQMVLMAMAAFPVLAGAAVLSTGPRRPYAWMTLAAAAGMLLVVGPHYLYVRSFTPGLTPALYVQWQRVRFSEGLSPIPDVLVVKGALPWIQDRLRGFTLAFDPRDKTFSYAARYQAFPYALVAAAPLLAWLGVRNASRDRLRAGWAWVRRPENLPWVHAVVLATGCFVMIHSMHMQRGRPYPEWYFSQRHALVCAFAFFLSLLLLFTRGRSAGKLVGVCILCASVYLASGQSVRARGARGRARAGRLGVRPVAERRGGATRQHDCRAPAAAVDRLHDARRRLPLVLLRHQFPGRPRDGRARRRVCHRAGLAVLPVHPVAGVRQVVPPRPYPRGESHLRPGSVARPPAGGGRSMNTTGVVVVPAYNEEQALPAFVERLIERLTAEGKATGIDFSVLVVDDGSIDRTAAVLEDLTARYEGGGVQVGFISLTRNFGHQAAVVAGMLDASPAADFVITMDADGEHPLTLIPELVARWREGAPIVHTARRPDRGSLS